MRTWNLTPFLWLVSLCHSRSPSARRRSTKVGALTLSNTPFDHFFFNLDGKYKVLFDTGCFATWLMTDAAKAGGYSTVGKSPVACHKELLFGVGSGPNANSFYANHCLTDTARLGTLRWSVNLLLTDRNVSWWQNVGVVGASLESDFAKAYPVFTVVPRSKRFDVLVGREPLGLKCLYVPLALMGHTLKKWIISGRVRVGESGEWVTKDFEVDTGFPPMPLSDNLWEQVVQTISANGGTVSGAVNGGYGQIVSNCRSLDIIPFIEYAFDGSSGSVFKRRVPASNFSTRTNDECQVYATLGDDRPFSFLPAPFLRMAIVRYDAGRKQVGFCKRKS